jgi:hypothetical protein
MYIHGSYQLTQTDIKSKDITVDVLTEKTGWTTEESINPLGGQEQVFFMLQATDHETLMR